MGCGFVGWVEADVEGWLSREMIMGMYAMQLQGDWYSQARLEHSWEMGVWGGVARPAVKRSGTTLSHPRQIIHKRLQDLQPVRCAAI